MKDANGDLLPQSRITDPETGLPNIQGDGLKSKLLVVMLSQHQVSQDKPLLMTSLIWLLP